MAIRAEPKAVRPSRRAVRAVEQVRETADPSLAATLSRCATSRTAITAYVVIGTAGLAALAVAIIGPKRLEKEVLRPLRGALEPQAEKLWAESHPLREQIAGLFRSASPAGRARLARNFQSWIGHFHAT